MPSSSPCSRPHSASAGGGIPTTGQVLVPVTRPGAPVPLRARERPRSRWLPYVGGTLVAAGALVAGASLVLDWIRAPRNQAATHQDLAPFESLYRSEAQWLGRLGPSWTGGPAEAERVCTALADRLVVRIPRTVTVLGPDGLPLAICP